MEDRQSANPGRVKLTLDSGEVLYGYLERADDPTVAGTPLNKATLFSQDNTTRYVADTPSEAFGLLGKVWGPFTLPVSGWGALGSDGYYAQTVSVADMSGQYYPSIVPKYTSSVLKDDEKMALGMIDFIVTEDGSFTAKATDIPDTAVTFYLVGV